MEDDLQKKKSNQSTKINLIGCDTIVNSPSYITYHFGTSQPATRNSLKFDFKSKQKHSNGRWPHFVCRLSMEDNFYFYVKGRQPQIFYFKWKMNFFYQVNLA